MLGLAGREDPRVLFVPTASGDHPDAVVRFYRSVTPLGCRPAHLGLFRREAGDLDELLARQDVIVVGGGSTANMLAVWRVHGLDGALRRAWSRGTVLAGVSAGAVCWFAGGVSDSWGPPPRPLTGGLGLLEGSLCPHHDSGPGRRDAFAGAVASGALPPGWAVDDGAALVFRGTAPAEAVSERAGAGVVRVEPDGQAPVPVRVLAG